MECAAISAVPLHGTDTIAKDLAMLRGFTDTTGVEWRVWEVVPSRAAIATSSVAQSRTSLSSTPYANGWLCFESEAEKRRLAPIPNGWELVSPNEIAQLLEQATPVQSRARLRGSHA
jgi:hypothetical protein